MEKYFVLSESFLRGIFFNRNSLWRVQPWWVMGMTSRSVTSPQKSPWTYWYYQASFFKKREELILIVILGEEKWIFLLSRGTSGKGALLVEEHFWEGGTKLLLNATSLIVVCFLGGDFCADGSPGQLSCFPCRLLTAPLTLHDSHSLPVSPGLFVSHVCKESHSLPFKNTNTFPLPGFPSNCAIFLA